MEKISLPMKTKIAAYGLMISGGIVGSYGFWGIISSLGYEWGFLFIVVCVGIVFLGILNFIPGFLLFQRQKKGLKISTILIPIISLILISWSYDFFKRGFWPGFVCSFFPSLINISSLILLLIDRQNFLRAVEVRASRIISTQKMEAIPSEIKGWNWGTFFLTWIWGIANKTYISFLCFIPFVNIIMRFVLGAKGNEWAWRNKKWESIEHFKKIQRRWALAGVIVTLFSTIILILKIMLG